MSYLVRGNKCLFQTGLGIVFAKPAAVTAYRFKTHKPTTVKRV
jgi:hypothetical protein